MARFQPLRVIRFGSRARGTAHAASDVDLLVVLAEMEDKRRAAVEVRRLLADLPVAQGYRRRQAGRGRAPRRGPGSLLRHALREGRVIL